MTTAKSICWPKPKPRAAAFGLVCAALASAATAAYADQPTVERPPIRFGARIDTPPMSYRDEGQQFRGYSIDICESVRETYAALYPDRAIEPGYVEVTAENREEKLSSGDVDVICGPFSMTARRMETFDFSFLVFASGASVATLRRPQTLGQPLLEAGAAKPPARVAVVSETTTEALVRKQLRTSVDIVRKADHMAAFAALIGGEADYYFGDRVILTAVAERSNAGADVVVGGKFLTYEPYALPFARGKNGDLRLAANLAIAKLYRDGGIKHIYKNNFGERRPSELLLALYRLYALPER